MYRYIDPSDDSFLKKDETYQRLKEQLEPFISNLTSEDKETILKTISNCYHQYHNSITAKSRGDTEIMLSTVMSLLIKQSNEIERLHLLTKAR
ncbi:hypothetical protein [Candidatus Nitrosocosmicus sp. T]